MVESSFISASNIAIIGNLGSLAAIVISIISAKIAKNAYDIGRLNALLAMEAHFRCVFEAESAFASRYEGTQGAQTAINDAGTADRKRRKISSEINNFNEQALLDVGVIGKLRKRVKSNRIFQMLRRKV